MLILQNSEDHNRSHSRFTHPRSFTYYRLKPFVIFLFLSAQVALTHSCETIKSQKSQCQICQSQVNFQCTYTTASKQTISANYSSCLSYCCNLDRFANASSYHFCQNAINISTTTEAGTSNASLVVILVFVILASICLVISLRSCLKRCKQQQKQENQRSASAINLAAYNIDEFGPLYQDRTQNCSICLDKDCNIRTKCSHSYHSQCLNAWITKQQKCPLCLSIQFNPILIYCTGCFKQSKLAILKGNKQIEQKQVWQKYQEYKCDSCLQDTQDAVSFTIEEAQNNKKEGQKNTVSKIDSQVRILQ